MSVNKVGNEYADAFPDFEHTPKAVIAAIAFSLALRIEEDDDGWAKTTIVDEWHALYKQGIVQQKPTTRAHRNG